MKQRLYFDISGIGEIYCPAYAMYDPDDDYPTPAGAVAHAIARKNGMEVIIIKQDGLEITYLDLPWMTVRRCYQVTLGYSTPGGGLMIKKHFRIYIDNQE